MVLLRSFETKTRPVSAAPARTGAPQEDQESQRRKDAASSRHDRLATRPRLCPRRWKRPHSPVVWQSRRHHRQMPNAEMIRAGRRVAMIPLERASTLLRMPSRAVVLAGLCSLLGIGAASADQTQCPELEQRYSAARDLVTVQTNNFLLTAAENGCEPLVRRLLEVGASRWPATGKPTRPSPAPRAAACCRSRCCSSIAARSRMRATCKARRRCCWRSS